MFEIENILIYIYIFLFIYLVRGKVMKSNFIVKKTKKLGKSLYGTDQIEEFAESLFYLLTPYMIYKGYIAILNGEFNNNITDKDFILKVNLYKAIKNRNGEEVSRILQELKNNDIEKYNEFSLIVLSFEIKIFESMTQKRVLLPSDKKIKDEFISIYQYVNIDCRINRKKCIKYSLAFHPDKNKDDPDPESSKTKFQNFGQIRELLETIYEK